MRNTILNQLGINSWTLRDRNHHEQVAPSSYERLSFEQLEAKVKSCTACPLHQGRTQTVFGVGSKTAKLMLIGEAPGFHEDQQGEPFVGRAGQLLNAMLQSIGLQRESVFIANILKCRPPQNRDPQPQEVASCLSFLHQQIDLIQPVLLIAVGRVAAHNLLNKTVSLESLRGRVHHYGEHAIPLIVTYHPAYLLRNPVDKKKAYLDWCDIKHKVDGLS